MALKRRPPRTWLEVAVVNAGFRDAIRALNWANSWAVVWAKKGGEEPTVEEVAEWWAMGRRTAFRDQAAFRKAFPTLESPAAMYQSEQAMAGLRAWADLGDWIDQKADERRARREQSIATLGVDPVPPGFTG
jgi:hypothetical protein